MTENVNDNTITVLEIFKLFILGLICIVIGYFIKDQNINNTSNESDSFTQHKNTTNYNDTIRKINTICNNYANTNKTTINDSVINELIKLALNQKINIADNSTKNINEINELIRKTISDKKENKSAVNFSSNNEIPKKTTMGKIISFFVGLIKPNK